MFPTWCWLGRLPCLCGCWSEDSLQSTSNYFEAPPSGCWGGLIYVVTETVLRPTCGRAWRRTFTTLYPWVYPTFFLIEKPRLAILLPAILDRVDSTCRPYPPRSLPSVYSMVAKLLASRLAEHRKVLYPWLRTGQLPP